ncbi:hypothetical protein BGZ72_005559 [Mortierella alpina]|nr:hypothetical protein BGZ72_005559 [Mortierella alpina]
MTAAPSIIMARYKALTVFNFIIGTCALSFQIGVLYPWHHQLDEDFKKLQKHHESNLQLFHNKKWEKLNEIDSKITALLEKMHK